MPACHSADYEPRMQKCYYSNNHAAPKIEAEAFMSFHSLGCTGACSGCTKDCNSTDNAAMDADLVGCDADHGRLIVSGGINYRLYCAHCWHSSNSVVLPNAKTMKECSLACANEPQCFGFNYFGPGGGCNYHVESATNTPYIQKNMYCDLTIDESTKWKDTDPRADITEKQTGRYKDADPST